MTPPRRRGWEWLALIVLFLLAGIIGHDPWKQDETYSFGIIHHFYSSGSWLVPLNAGVPFMEKPPLYYWTATLLCHVFGGVLPLHDAARLASFFFMLLAAGFMWKLSKVLLRDRALRWVALALLLGSLGLARHAHDMFTDVALLAGTVIALYGMALLACTPKEWIRAGVWLGLGTGIAFLSKGFLTPAIMDGTFCLLWALTPAMQTRKTIYALLAALAAAAPFLFIWPLLLWRHSPELFTEWFWNNNVGRFLGFSVGRLGAENEPHYFFGAIVWFAFPSFPLACAALAVLRRQWRQPNVLLPLAFAGVGLALLVASASARALYLLPLLPAFALLGAQGLAHIPPAWQVRWNHAVRVIFSLLAGSLWAVWAALLLHERTLTRPLSRWLPLDFTPPHSQAYAIVLASALTLLWLAALRLPLRSAQNTAYIWLAGVAAVWGISNTLLLPWFDYTKTYRGVLAEMENAIPGMPGACITTSQLGESISPMLEYFNPRKAVPGDANSTACPLLLSRTPGHVPVIADARWHMVWHGHRPLDEKDEELRLYVAAH